MAILFVCTGNASRSVMAESMLRVLAPGWEAASAGTHSIEGQPMSWRTRDALARLGYGADWHRSRQADADDLDRAELVAVFERFQLEWVRREHPVAAPRTASLYRLATTLPPPGADPAGDLAARVASLHLERAGWEPEEEVVDPGGGEVEAYAACAVEVLGLVGALAPRLGPAPSPRSSLETPPAPPGELHLDAETRLWGPVLGQFSGPGQLGLSGREES